VVKALVWQDGVAVVRDALPEDLPNIIDIEAERATMVVSRFQARAAMHLAGLLTAVESVVIAADPLTQIAWADATEFRRTSPTIATIAAALNLTDAALDDLFRSAAQITA
jgi:hypothetical protein